MIPENSHTHPKLGHKKLEAEGGGGEESQKVKFTVYKKSMNINLNFQGSVVRKAINVNPRLKVNQGFHLAR